MTEASHRRRLRARLYQSADRRSRHRRGRIMTLRTLMPGKPGTRLSVRHRARGWHGRQAFRFAVRCRLAAQRPALDRLSARATCTIRAVWPSLGRSWWSSTRGPVLAVQQPSTATLARSGGHDRVSRPAREPVSQTRRRRLLRGELTRRVSLAVRIRSLLASIVEQATINDADIAVSHGSLTDWWVEAGLRRTSGDRQQALAFESGLRWTHRTLGTRLRIRRPTMATQDPPSTPTRAIHVPHAGVPKG